MLKYKTIIFGLAAVMSAILASRTSNEDYSAYFVVSGMVFGAITIYYSLKATKNNDI